MQVDAVAEGFRLTISEMPLNGSTRHRPAVNHPPGGFFVVQTDERPQGLRPGAEITVVGEVLGAYRHVRDEQVTAVPLLAERYLRVWGPSWWPRFLIGISGSISP